MRAGSPVGETLRIFADENLAEAEDAIGRPGLPDAVAVHGFRKAMKRWRAFLRLVEPLVGEDAASLRLAARDHARRLSAARDSQSALDALEDIQKAEPPLSPRTLASIRRRLEDLRDHAETVALTDEMRASLAAYLAEARSVVEGWPLQGLAFPRVAKALAIAYARARSARPKHWEDAEDEALHRLRRRLVVHRYQMPLVDGLWPRLNRLVVGEAQRMRERLGAYQDLAVLTRLMAPHGPLAPWRSRLTPLIAARKAAHVDAAARIGDRLLAEKPAAFRRRLIGLWKAGGTTA